MAEVLEDVLHRAGNLPQRLQHVHVVAVGEHLPGPRGEPVEGTRQADCQALDGAREGGRVLRLDDEVQMRALDRVVHDPHSEALLGLPERVLDRALAAVAAKEADAESEPHRHVHRMPRRKAFPALMRNPGPVACRLAPGSLPLAAPDPQSQCELLH